MSNTTKIIFDTEFTGLHQNTTLISLGLISDNGKTFYSEFTDYAKSQVNDWIQENVIDIMSPNTMTDYYCHGKSKFISKSLKRWLSQFENVEWVADVGHYDFVLLLNLLYGEALNAPDNICAAYHDLNQDIAWFYNISDIEAFNKSREDILRENGITIEGTKHNALYDAKVAKAIYEKINIMRY